MTTPHSATEVPPTAQELFHSLEEHFAEYADLNTALALLSWDQETYMPQGAAEGRGSHLKTLSGLAHRHFTSPVVGRLLDALDRHTSDLTPMQALAARELRRDYEREIRVPESLVRALAEQQSVAMEAWKIARERSDFPVFAPHLEKLLALKRQVAAIWGYSATPYDALHDAFERGSTAAALRPIFDRMRQRLVPLLKRIRGSAHVPCHDALDYAWPLEQQWRLTMRVLSDMGFDLDCGRQDRSIHPFSTAIGAGDTRLTTRLREDDLTVGLGGTMHEAGHGLYEQGLDRDRTGLILAEATSLGIHESQSRLWENLVGKSRPFMDYLVPLLREYFPREAGNLSPDALYEAMNIVQPSLIRVEADEVTYNLHVLVRFEIELMLVEETLPVKDLPKAWNDRYEEYLGVRPANDAEGCLQDIHWSMGHIGYFPTYTLGNLHSVPIFQAAQREVPQIGQKVDKDSMFAMREWLRQEVHGVGRSETADQISRRITGGPLSPEPFLDYLEAKYTKLYRLG